jgi:hypothetical protein
MGLLSWLLAFALTCSIELVAIRLLAPQQPHLTRIALYAQLVTHPLVWIAMATLPGPQFVKLAGIELWATVVEAALYARFLRIPRGEAFALSAAANAASLLIVAALAMLFG